MVVSELTNARNVGRKVSYSMKVDSQCQFVGVRLWYPVSDQQHSRQIHWQRRNALAI